MNTEVVRKRNQFFDLNRFWLLNKATFVEKKRSFMWFFAVIAMIYSLILMMMYDEIIRSWDVQAVFFYIGLFTTGFVFSTRYFANFARKNSALIALMQPVSVFEKWLLAIITTVVIYPIIYTLIYTVMTWPLVIYADIPTWFEGEPPNLYFFLPFRSYPYAEEFVFLQWYFLLGYLTLCAYSIMASIFFKSLPLLKTFVLAFCLFLFFLFVSKNINPDMSLLLHYAYKSSESSLSYVVTANILFWVLPAILLMAASFFALKERELS